nr:MAG TPA: hypothetical protein [Caudoviricetes sp.]
MSYKTKKKEPLPIISAVLFFKNLDIIHHNNARHFFKEK